MGVLHLPSISVSHNFNSITRIIAPQTFKTSNYSSRILVRKPIKIKAVGTKPGRQSETSSTTAAESTPDSPPTVSLAFVSSVLLPDGTPDVHLRSACGGENLRQIMLDTNLELYGPYSRVLLNCAGGGTCGTCIVEVIEGKENLSPRTDKEKEKLKRNPKNWRLACQVTVGKPGSTGLVAIQQLPEWKGHEWTIGKVPPPEEQS